MNPDYRKTHIFNQLKSITSTELFKALNKDSDWELVQTKGGSKHWFRHTNDARKVCIHIHPKRGGYRDKSLLKDILRQIGWSEDKMRELKLIK